MRAYPLADPGVPDHRSPARYLRWLAGVLRVPLALGALYGAGYMLAGSLTPVVVGHAIDGGLLAADRSALLGWGGVLLGLVLAQSATAVAQERCDFASTTGASLHTMTLVNRQASRVGAVLGRRSSAGEVVSTGVGDPAAIGAALASTSRGAGAVVAIATVSTIMLLSAWRLGLVVLVGVPLIFWVTAWALGPLRRRQAVLRERQGELTALAVDLADGLRVLRGLGAEDRFVERYRDRSQAARRLAVDVARVQALLGAVKVLLPGFLATAVVWLGARLVLADELRVGQFVAFYGYAVFLTTPLRWLTDTAEQLGRGHVAAARVCRVLGLRRRDPEVPGDRGHPGGELVDPDSGLRIQAGRLVGVACGRPQSATEIADRLARYTGSEVTWGGTRLVELPLAEVRRRILAVHNHDRLFSGRLRDELDPFGRRSDEALAGHVWTASAADVVAALPGGLDGRLQAAGRNVSGGQRQRLRLVRALAAEPDVLILVDPTSAVDASTEATIVRRLRDARRGRTTVVFSTSPMVLAAADTVVFLPADADGAARGVAAEGTHADLLAVDAYRALVTRGVELG